MSGLPFKQIIGGQLEANDLTDALVAAFEASGKPFTVSLQNLYSLYNQNYFIANIMDYGASPQAADNREAIQIAVNIAEGLNGAVFIPPGRFNVNPLIPIVVPSNVTIYGIHDASIINVVSGYDPDNPNYPPYPLAHDGVFVSGNTLDGNRAALPLSGSGLDTVFDLTTLIASGSFHNFVIDGNINGPPFGIDANWRLVGIDLWGARRFVVRNMRVVNMLNTGIHATVCSDGAILDNVVEGCGRFGVNPSTRNGISLTGWISRTQQAQINGRNCIISRNKVNDSGDAGIQFAGVHGILINDNIIRGYSDKAIEGDNWLATTDTSPPYTLEIPGDAIIKGNYCDSLNYTESYTFGDTSLFGNDGIFVNTGNQNRLLITDNVVKRVRRTAIGGVVANDGVLQIYNNSIEEVGENTEVNYQGILATAKEIYITGNRLDYARGSGGISVQGAPKVVKVTGNLVNNSFAAPLNFSLSSSEPTYEVDLIEIYNNETKDCNDDAVLISINSDMTIKSLVIDSNTFLNYNANTSKPNSATDYGTIKIRIDTGVTALIESFDFNHNKGNQDTPNVNYPLILQNFPLVPNTPSINFMRVVDNDFKYGGTFPGGRIITVNEETVTLENVIKKDNIYGDLAAIEAYGTRLLYTPIYNSATLGGSVSLGRYREGNIYQVALRAGTNTIQLPQRQIGAGQSQLIEVHLINPDPVGGATVSFTPRPSNSIVTDANGLTTISAVAGGVTIYEFITNHGSGVWYGYRKFLQA